MYSPATEEDHRDERGGGVEAVGTPSDRANLAVHALGSPIAEAGANVLKDAVQVPVDCVRRFGEVFEAAPLRVRDPLVEHAARYVDLSAVEDRGEGLFEDVSAEDRPVGMLEFLQSLVVGIREVPRTLEQGPARVLERLLLLLARARAHLVAARLVQGVLDQSLHVEAIEHEPRLWDHLLDDADVGIRHVNGHALDRCAPLRSQFLEEGTQGLGILPLGRPDHHASYVVDHDGDVFVVAPVAELVDANVHQPIEAISGYIEFVTNDPIDDAADSSPCDTQEFLNGSAAALLREIAGAFLERTSKVATGSSPGHLLSLDRPASDTVDAADGVPQVDHHPGQIEVAPSSDTAIFHPAGFAAAFTAPDTPLPGSDIDNQAEPLEAEAADHKVLDGKDDSE